MTALSVEPNPRVTFAVRYEDDHLAVVAKPPHVPTQPGKAHQNDTLLNGLFARWGERLQQLGRQRDFGLLHRLDRQTSGLLIVALSPPAWDRLRADFESRRIGKFYWAVCVKAPAQHKGVISLPIAEAQRDRKLAVISPAGKPARTAYRVLGVSVNREGSTDAGEADDPNASRAPRPALLECRTLTGRLHQVRVHLSAIHCPILGDDFYAPPRVRAMSPRLALHAHRLCFDHPVTAERIDVRTTWPKDLRVLLTRFNLPRPDHRDA